MKTFIFTATTTIVAESLEAAQEIFANNSWDFASTAEIDENGSTKHAGDVY